METPCACSASLADNRQDVLSIARLISQSSDICVADLSIIRLADLAERSRMANSDT
jgi:hypothetical protein